MTPKYDSLRKDKRDREVWAYYQEHLPENLSHQEIADHFKVSRPTITRILGKFRTEE